MKEIYSDLLDKDIIELMNKNLAKPDKTILEHTNDLLNELNILLKLGYIEEDRIFKLVQKSIIYHDIGKINREFQKRINKKNGKFNEEVEVVHNILSLYFIDKDKFETLDDYIRVAHAVFNHHYYCNNFEELTNKQNIIEDLLKDFKTEKVKRKVKSLIAGIVEDKEAVKIKGYLHKCDYCASSGTVIEYPNNFLKNSMNNLLNEWKKLNLKSHWNELQEFCYNNSDKNIIAVAQTGMGKTEGGLIWIGDNKGFFVLPIRTAINAIYDRVRKGILKNKDIEARVAILHSSSLEYYLNNVKNETENIDMLNYYKTGKQLSIPLNIATMDSMFDFVYKYPAYELKLTTLSYSKIVIDEIQAYGPDLLAYLIYGLEKIAEQGGKIAVLTATLPPFVKGLLSKNINFKESEKPFINDLKRHNVKALDKHINSVDIKNMFLNNMKLGCSNKILVVCNTIKEAQKLYNELKECEEIDNKYINILHSRFIRKERLEKENKILDFGKTYNKEGKIDFKKGIWISTSIVEASLDIDFDYLFTELQDLNSLFQRLGRCNRKGVKNSENYNCYIYCSIDEKNFVDGDKGFIDRTMFNLSKEAILLCDGALSEEDKINLINKYLTYDNLKSSDYMRKYNEVYNYICNIPPYKFDVKEVDLRNILSEDIIPGPVYEKYLGDIKEIQEKLLDFSIGQEERIKLKDKIKQYTVSVYPGDSKQYEIAKSKGKAIYYDNLSLSNYKNDYIKVIDCSYDDSGYKKIKYDNQTKGAIIW